MSPLKDLHNLPDLSPVITIGRKVENLRREGKGSKEFFSYFFVYSRDLNAKTENNKGLACKLKCKLAKDLLCRRRLKSLSSRIFKVNQQVMVKVTEVDIARKRIALSMKTDEPADRTPKFKQPERRESKPAPKNVHKPSPRQEPETDIAIKLAALKNKFS